MLLKNTNSRTVRLLSLSYYILIFKNKMCFENCAPLNPRNGSFNLLAKEMIVCIKGVEVSICEKGSLEPEKAATKISVWKFSVH